MQATSIETLAGWLNELAVARDQALKEESTKVRLKSPSFLRPFHFVTLALEARRLGIDTLDLAASLHGYAARMHLWEAAGLKPPLAVSERSENGRFMPVQPLNDANKVFETARDLARVVRRNGWDGESSSSIEVALSELVENCFAHSAIKDGLFGLACAQSWPGGNRAQIAICDCGNGIRESLEGNPALLDRLGNENACELATELGVTGAPGRGHSGYGLALSRQLMEQCGGVLLLVSSSEFFAIDKNGRPLSGSLAGPWPGTLVALEWQLDRPLKVKDVYKAWPLSEGFTDDDFDFF